MNLKTMSKHLDELSKAVITKQEINAISKFIGGLRFNDRQTRINKDFAELLISVVNEKQRKITKEQAEFGIKWLKDKYIKNNGEPRKCLGDDFGYLDVNTKPDDAFKIINEFKHFRFIGFTGRWSSQCRQYVELNPVYLVTGKDGQSFSYTAYYMGKTIINPEIIFSVF